MRNKIFGILQRIGKSFMLPIATLPIAGLLLGIGISFTNQATLSTYGLVKIMGPNSSIYINSNEKILRSTGAAGIIIKGEGVQIIYGPNVNIVKTNLEDYLLDVPDELL